MIQKLYVRLLSLMGLAVDHHGWIFKDESPSETQVQLRAYVFERSETSRRLLRLLEAIHWKGYSTTEPGSQEYWYKDGLVEYIQRNHTLLAAA